MILSKLKYLIFRAFAISWLIVGFVNYTFSQDSLKIGNEIANPFIPDYVKFQFAGGIGFMSTGIGYSFVDQRLDVSYFYGYIPNYFTVDDLHSVSLQLTAKLLRINLNDEVEILPLNFGWYIHHTFGDEFWLRTPDHYPKGYYWWYPGGNAGIFVGGEIKTKFLSGKTPASGVAFYTRVGTRGLYLASKFSNSTIPFYDILELGFGIAIYR